VKYRVILEKSAHEDLEAIIVWLAQHSEEAARAWYTQAVQAIESLDTAPFRCPCAPENEVFLEEIRQLLHGRKRYVYRILFTVRGEDVHVLHVRHGGRRPLTPGE